MIVTTPVRTPLAVGEKVTAIVQMVEAATGLEVEQVVLGSSVKSPLDSKAVMESGLVPVLVNVTDCAAAVVPTTVLPKLRLEGVSITPGAVPVPLSVMVWLPPLALSVVVTTPVRTPLAVGVKATAIVQVFPAATGVETEQVVPASRAKSPLAVRVAILSGLLPMLVNVTDCAAAVVPATALPNVRLDGFNETPGAVPVPTRVMFCVPPPALSLIVTAPVREPVAVGENVTAIVHVPEAATSVEIEQVVPAPRAKSPLAASAVILSALLPVLVKVTDCAAAVVPTTVLPKLRLEGVSITPGAVPVPLSVMVWLPPLALSVMVTTPVRTPLAVGVKVTAIVQVFAAATGVEIEQVEPASRAKSPLAARAVMESALVPVLVSVTDCAVAVVPITVLPKVRLEGVSVTPAAVPVPLSAIFCVPPLALSVMVTTPVRTPLATGLNAAAIRQVVPAGTGLDVEQVVLESRTKSPLDSKAVIESGLVPALVNVTDCAAAVVPTTVLPNVRLEGVSETPGAVPVPVSAAVFVPLLEAILSVPLRTPVAVGANVTPTTHVALALSALAVEQVVVGPSTLKSPLVATLLKLTAAVPLLVTVRLCALLVVPTV